MANLAFRIAPVRAIQQNELYFHLYMGRDFKGPKENQNQAEMTESKLAYNFGTTAVNDWPLYDGPGPNAKIVARAQGLHIQAGVSSWSYYNSLNIVFEDYMFKGSTLQVMGPVMENGDWAIVGGTGQFNLAQGVVNKKFHESTSTGKVVEVHIHAFYSSPAQGSSSIWTLGP